MFSKTEGEHSGHVREVLQRIKDNTLFIKLSNCEFFKEEVDFCGHRIGQNEISTAPDKVAAIQVRPNITTLKQLQHFLGMTVWFQDFVYNYAKITSPLTDMLRKPVNNRKKWSDR